MLFPTYSNPGKAGQCYAASVLWGNVPVHWLSWLLIDAAALFLAFSPCNNKPVLGDMAGC